METNRFDASQSEDGRYRLLVDAIHDYAIYMLDRTGIVTSWNSGAERFKGYTAAEIIGQHFSRFYTEEDKAAGKPESALRTAADRHGFESEGWRIKKDGSRFWAHVVIDPIRDPGGELIGFAKITRDLTERRANEDQIRRTEEQFRLLVEGVTDYAIYMLDPTGRVSSWNAGAKRIKQYSRDEIIGQHFSNFYTDEDRSAGLPERGLTIAKREGRWEQEGWRQRKDGSRFRAHVIIDAIRDKSGELLGFAKVTRDITERMEAEKALARTQQALFQSQKTEALGQLTGGVAHDFNNLLTAILGSLELVLKRLPHDERITPLLENAVAGARRGATLTQRMLAFARRQDLKLEGVSLRELVKGLLVFAERTIGRDIQTRFDIPMDLPPVLTDANQLENAILNLLVNARDAMPNGGGISISARSCTQPGDSEKKSGAFVCLSITDTGEGMDEETLRRATEPFFTTKGVGKGTGLGLSMVHGIVTQSGGRLALKSKPNAGTTVEIWLPVADGYATAAMEPGEMPAKSSVVRRLVLAVDDDTLVLMNTAALLDDLGYDVIEAHSGQEALEAIAENPDINLVITDHAMPKMTGLQLIEALRQQRPDLPVIIATGYAELPSGASSELHLLGKPFTQVQLATAISKVNLPAIAG